MNDIGRKIREYRNKMGLSMTELGRRIGKTRSAISQYESGKIVPRMGVIEDLASVFGVSKSDIIGEAERYSYSELESREEKELIASFRMMNDAEKEALLSTARAFMAAKNRSHAGRPVKQEVGN